MRTLFHHSFATILFLLVLECVPSTNSQQTANENVSAPLENSTATTCTSKSYFNNKISTCETFQIATLNSSPRRCLHIEVPAESNSKETKSNDIGSGGSTVCVNYPNWHDGTNSCSGYERAGNHNWCSLYGHLDYRPTTPYTANAACCICGGGFKMPMSNVRFAVGDLVKVHESALGASVRGLAMCKPLKVVEINFEPSFAYVLEVQKACGPAVMKKNGKGVIVRQLQFQQGMKFTLENNRKGAIDEYLKVDLKKCRSGRVEQEFEFVPVAVEGNENIDMESKGEEGRKREQFIIYHKATNLTLGETLRARSTLSVEPVFENDLFEGSDDIFFIHSTDIKGNKSQVLGNGEFGKTEFSEPAWQTMVTFFDGQSFAMWTFREVSNEKTAENVTSNGSSETDEHAQWLIRTTQTIGIDYLEELTPWHLLDVERTASKQEVKSRFRELGRIFHPDKTVIDSKEKKELYEQIFVLLQHAYDGLKSANEKEKESFRSEADFDSQLFTWSNHVVELLPFHWTKVGGGNGNDSESDVGAEDEAEGNGNDIFTLNVASHQSSLHFNETDSEDEDNVPSIQIWVVIKYSAKCSMSRNVEGFIDLAARHLKMHENIKVGAYGCGLYKDFKATKEDALGVKTDPICKQFHRTETPNVHVIVETLPVRKQDEKGNYVLVPPDPKVVRDNAKFQYFYTEVPDGNTTQFYPQNMINFAKKGKKVWNDSHLVRFMTKEDFVDPMFLGNVSVVAYLDGTGSGGTNSEVADALTSSLPGLARRFLDAGLYVGVASCGYGEEFDDEDDDFVDCSMLGVEWLPDVKLYGADDDEGVSLLRGEFGDRRDVQISLETMGNVLSMMFGGIFDDDEGYEEMKDDEIKEEGSCSGGQQPPQYDTGLDEIDGGQEETMLIDLDTGEDDQQPKPSLDQGGEKARQKPQKPKLASSENKPRLTGVRESSKMDFVSGFHSRAQQRRGRGTLLGGGGGRSAGAIAG